MTEYRLVFLTPGQQMPSGGTGIAVGSGIVWTGVSGTFPTTVAHGLILPSDTLVSSTYDSRLMTEDEIYTYNNPPDFDDEDI